MKEIAISEVRTRLSALLFEVERGEQFLITRRGLAVARLVGVAAATLAVSSERVIAATSALRDMRKGMSQGGDVRTMIAEGRD